MARIAVDYDETFTDDPLLWGAFVHQARARLHEVFFVTYRPEKGQNEDILYDAECLGIKVFFTDGRQKQHVVDADIWIDDSPETVVSFDKLVGMYDGCVTSKDFPEEKADAVRDATNVLKNADGLHKSSLSTNALHDYADQLERQNDKEE